VTLGGPFVVGPPEDRARPWRVLTDGSASAGIGFGDARIEPGAPGPGRHVHTHEDEGIYVIAGILTVEVGAHRYEAGPETLVCLPRGIPHVFANLGDETVRTVGVFNSVGLAEMFAEQASYFESLTGPPDLQFSWTSACGTAFIRSKGLPSLHQRRSGAAEGVPVKGQHSQLGLCSRARRPASARNHRGAGQASVGLPRRIASQPC
jgi:mannose-6-phosphate isomerase-like protein (cupin superfamily)